MLLLDLYYLQATIVGLSVSYILATHRLLIETSPHFTDLAIDFPFVFGIFRVVRTEDKYKDKESVSILSFYWLAMTS